MIDDSHQNDLKAHSSNFTAHQKKGDIQFELPRNCMQHAETSKELGNPWNGKELRLWESFLVSSLRFREAIEQN